jgi:sphinganine-1-phosphate aldolase
MSVLSTPSSRGDTLIRFTQLTNDVLDSRHLQHLKNIVFILVLLNYWSKLYNKVIVGGPVRAAKDFKAYILKVST